MTMEYFQIQDNIYILFNELSFRYNLFSMFEHTSQITDTWWLEKFYRGPYKTSVIGIGN